MLCVKINTLISKQLRSKSYSTLSYLHNLGKEPLKSLTIGRLLEQSANKYGDRNALIIQHQNKRASFQNILDEADKLAAGLKNLGLEKGDRLGLWAPNLYEWYLTKMACARAGLITVAINPAYQPPEIEYCIKKVGIKSIICAHKFKTQNYYEILKKIASEIDTCVPGELQSANIPTLKSVIVISDENLRGALKYKEVLNSASGEAIQNIKSSQLLIRPDDPCNIQFTSGTTGNPKAATLSHFNLVNNSYNIGKRNELDLKHHTIGAMVPFFHAFGIAITLLAALNHGATLVIPSEGYSPKESLKTIKNERCTIIHGTPTMYVDLIKEQLEAKEELCAEIAVSGGSPLSPHLVKQMKEVLRVDKVKSVYGLTETTAVAFQSVPGDDDFKSSSTVGKLHEHLEAKIVDSDNNIVPIGTPGELYVRGYCNMLCYWEDEDKTKETIGEDGWLQTGDKFLLSEDGYGTVVGRIKEMLIRGGENIFPKEIEDFINTHPNVIECFVIGLPHERLGQEVCACVRLKKNEQLNHKNLVDYCKGKIAHFKIPSKLVIMEDFPKTTSGKIQKFKILEEVLKMNL